MQNQELERTGGVYQRCTNGAIDEGNPIFLPKTAREGLHKKS